MNRLKPDKINFKTNDFVVEIDNEEDINEETVSDIVQEEIPVENDAELIEAKSEADLIIENAKQEKEKILNEASTDCERIKNDAQNEANKIIDEANKQSQELLESSKAELEKQITASANEGYKAGYDDGLEKVKEELISKIEDFDKFCLIQTEIKNKILKSASRDILDIIINISKKILQKNVDSATIEKIILNTISLLEKKDDINIILSEKYAKLLFDLQNNSLAEEKEFKFENFKQYKGFNVIFNPKFDDDTIIIENLSERFDASINAQLDVIVRDIFEKTQNGKIEDIDKLENET